MSGIPAGAILHIGGKTVLNRLQTAGLQNPQVPSTIVYETGNNLAVGRILTEADFRFQMTSWDVSTDLMALLCGETAAAIGDEISAGDAVGKEYRWENTGPINLTSPWKEDTGSQGGHIAAGVIVPSLFPTALTYRLGVTEMAEMQVTLSSGSYYMSEAMPLEEYAAGDGVITAFVSAHSARVYRIGGGGSTVYTHVFGVFVDGVQQLPGIDYTESGGANPEAVGGDTPVTIHFAVAPRNGAIVKYCYFSDTAAAIPQAMNVDTAVLPAAVRGRNIDLLIGDPGGSPLTLFGVQSYELQASRAGQLQRQMGTQDPIGFTETGVDCTGTVTLEPPSIDKLFQFMSEVFNVDRSEVYGYINTQSFPLTAVIHDPKHPANIIKSIFVEDAVFQAPGENARVQQVTQFPVTWESQNGSFSEFKGALPA